MKYSGPKWTRRAAMGCLAATQSTGKLRQRFSRHVDRAAEITHTLAWRDWQDRAGAGRRSAVRCPRMCPDRDTSGYTGGSWGLDSLVTREIRPDFRRGGMAEWAMAVVLKTTVRETVP